MNYIKGLYDTYNKLEEQGLIGQYDEDGLGIFPKYHNIKGVDDKGSAYEVIINSVDGSFTINKVMPNVDKNRKYLVYPTTIASFGRDTEGGVPHGVCDELKYISLSYSGNGNNNDTYIKQLKDWLDFTEGDIWVQTVYDFITNNDVGSLLETSYPDEIITSKTFITFAVKGEYGDIDGITNSKRLQNNWVEYIETTYSYGLEGYYTGGDDLTGETGIVPRKYGRFFGTSRILSKSKNDEYYKGRFIKKSGLHNIFSVTHETSQKAYNLLGYLINASGKNTMWLGSETRIIMWMDGEEIEPSIAVTDELDDFMFDDEYDVHITDSLLQGYLTNIRSNMLSETQIGTNYNVYILVLVKTNNGRSAVKKYQTLTDEGYQDVLNYWYATTSWESAYTNEDTKQISLGLRGLVNNLFGSEEEVGKYFNIKVNQGFEGKAVALIEDLIESKMNKQRLPIKFYKKAMMNVRQRHRYKNTWDKTLLTTLSMYKKYQWDYKNKYVGVDVEVENHSNSYLYGRLMAVYEQIESTALYYRGADKRQTFVEKNWSSIINRPLHMWDRMNVKTQPYMNYLLRTKPGIHHKFSTLVLELGAQIAENGDFATKGKKSLDDDFILGYYHQLKALRQKNTNNNQEEDTNE